MSILLSGSPSKVSRPSFLLAESSQQIRLFTVAADNPGCGHQRYGSASTNSVWYANARNQIRCRGKCLKKKAGTLQTIGRKIELLKIDKFRFLCRILKFPIDFQFGTKIKEWRTKKEFKYGGGGESLRTAITLKGASWMIIQLTTSISYQQALATRHCTEEATWYFNLQENRTWTNYSSCGLSRHSPFNTTLFEVRIL